MNTSTLLIFDFFFSQWKGEIQEFCPNTKMLLVGCKSDLRTDVSTLVELSNHRQTPVSYDQVCMLSGCKTGFKKVKEGPVWDITHNNKIRISHF